MNATFFSFFGVARTLCKISCLFTTNYVSCFVVSMFITCLFQLVHFVISIFIGSPFTSIQVLLVLFLNDTLNYLGFILLIGTKLMTI